jgi:hypothetical protein
MSAAAAPKLFISYRREETAGHAGRLYDAVADRFGADNVFMDVELAPGIDFVERITTAVGDCRALLVVIGPRWASVPAPDGGGQPRLTAAGDYVRLEVETALRRPDVRVIPVLVAGARMPSPEQLPASLRPLARRNAIELSDGRWRFDVGRLVDALDDTVAPAGAVELGAVGVADATASVREEAPLLAAQPAPLPPSERRRLFGEGVLVALLAGLIAYWIAVRFDRAVDFHDGQLALIVRRGMTWAFVAAALTTWLCLRRGETRRLTAWLLLGLVAGALAGVLDGLLATELPQAVDVNDRAALRVGEIAIVGAVIGLLLGGLWAPRQPLAGLAAGALGAALVQLLLNAVDTPGDPRGGEAQDYLFVAAQSVAIAAAVLATLFTLDARAWAARARRS